MTLRVEEKQHRRKETLESGTRHHLAKASSSAAHASEDALAQPIVIECRKKNSRQESVVTHRFRKGKLLGKVRMCRELKENMRLVFVQCGKNKRATAKAAGNRLIATRTSFPIGCLVDPVAILVQSSVCMALATAKFHVRTPQPFEHAQA